MNSRNPYNMILDSFSRVFDCLLLGLLWMVCSLPIITAGTAFTALYHAYNKSIRQDYGHPCREFFQAFKANFKQSTIVWLIVLVILLALYGDFCIVTGYLETIPLAGVLLAFAITLMAVAIAWSIYLLAYIARFELDTKTVMKNCLFIMGMNIGWSCLLLVVTVVAIAAFILAFFLGFAVAAVYIPICNRILERVFRKYMQPADLQEQLELSGEGRKN